MSTVFVGNLSPEITDERLREIFGQYGKVSSLRLISRRGFAYIELEADAAESAVAALRGTQLDGRTLDVVVDSSGGGRPGGGGRRRKGGKRR